MDKPAIGKLSRVPLRTVWEHEAYDFTQWLQENIDVLNTALDLNLVDVDREQASGSFSIDLVAEDEGGGTVIIENQLEKSNHDHLGKLITYLTGMSAKAAIWIVSDPRPEHVAAIAWLNESTSAAFYMVKVEAVRIGESPAAPLFTLIVGPSDETKEVGQTKRKSRSATGYESVGGPCLSKDPRKSTSSMRISRRANTLGLELAPEYAASILRMWHFRTNAQWSCI
jgi:hypothetical protein